MAPPLARWGSQAKLLQLQTSGRLQAPQPRKPVCNVATLIRVVLISLPHSRKLFCSFSRPGYASGFSIPPFCSSRQPLRAPCVSNLGCVSQPPLQPEASAPLTPPGSWVEAGLTAEPPPAASQPKRSGGLLGCLHLLFLKRRGKAERHHRSPGPSHRHTSSPAFRKKSNTAFSQKLGGRASER